MSTSHDLASIRGSIGTEVPSAISPRTSRSEGSPAIRSPNELRAHPALEKVGWTGVIDEFNEAARVANPSVPEPILITTSGIVLAGFGPWRFAVFERRDEVPCIEYSLSEDEALLFILTHHQTRCGWNDFVRICLALTREHELQQKALDNMRTGGKLKGLANLPEAQLIDVRKGTARAAGVGERNVTNVRTILQRAHPTLIEALKEGTLSINRAHQLCNLPKADQLDQFIEYSQERATNRVIRRSIPRQKEKRADLDVLAVLEALQRQEVQQPGSVEVRIGRHKRTVVLLGQDDVAGSHSQKGPKLT